MNRNQLGKNNPNYKDGHCIDNCCIDCDKEIHPQAIRCRPCENKHHAKLMKGKKGIKWTSEMKRDLSIKLGGNGIPYSKNKIKCSECGIEIYRGSTTCKNCVPKGKNHHRFGHIMKPNWIKYKSLWMRSSWELVYAKYLDKQNTKWQYESKTFDLGNTTYTPDFYLSKIKKYIEVKGYKSEVFKNKFKLFKKLYPRMKIEIVDKCKLLKLKLINKRGDIIS